MVDESDDTPKQSVGKGAVIGLVLGAIAVAVVAVGVGLYKKRQSRRAFDILSTSRRRDRHSTDSAVPWLSSRPSEASSSFSSHPLHPTDTPSSSLGLSHNSVPTAEDEDGTLLLPPRGSYIAPDPPSPTYSPLPAEGHTSGSTPRASLDVDGDYVVIPPSSPPPALPATPPEAAASPTRTLSSRRERSDLSLPPSRANSTVATSDVSTATAPPPYSPAVLGVGSVLSPRS